MSAAWGARPSDEGVRGAGTVWPCAAYVIASAMHGGMAGLPTAG